MRPCPNAFSKNFETKPEIIRHAVMLLTRFLRSRQNVENLFYERGNDFTREIVRFR